MNLFILIIAILLTASVGRAYNSEDDGRDGICAFGDDDNKFLFPVDFPGGCNENEDRCFPAVCEDFDLVIRRVKSIPSDPNLPFDGSSELTDNYAIWVSSNKDDSLICYESKCSTTLSAEDLGDEVMVTAGGHVLQVFDGNTTCTIPGIDTPGVYYLNGGIVQYTVNKETGARNITNATGSWVDVCAEIKAALEDNDEDCDSNTRRKCDKAEQCRWNKESESCDESCGNIDSRRKCEKADRCQWEKENDSCADETAESSVAFSHIFDDFEDDDTKENTNAGCTAANVRVLLALVSALMWWLN